MKKILEAEIKKRVQFFNNVDQTLLLGIEDAVVMINRVIKNLNKILVFGNGGSATQSSHFVAELVNRFYTTRQPINAISLTADMANITSIANDFDYRHIYERQVDAVGSTGDITIGISTSGTSENVLLGLEKSKQKGIHTIALCGSNIEALKSIDTDVILSVKETDTPLIQEVHLFILHFMAMEIEKSILNR